MPLSIRECLEQGPATSKALQTATGLSQAAVSRQLRGMQNSIVRLPSGRSPKYAMTCNAFGGDNRLPLYMVDAHGNNTAIAHIRPLANGGYFVEQLTGIPSVLLGESENGLYDDLPFFLDDLRPQGFLGRQIAEEMASQSDDFPSDPRNWNANHIGCYLISNGDDLPGNLKFGQQAHLRVRHQPIVTTEEDYPALADSVMSGVIPGSSAGGEQPKFTAFCGARSVHVIVKFSPRGNDVVARRWRDILVTEYHAVEVIHGQNLPAAETNLIEKDGRLFLESQRFDRAGEYGRLPMISLQSIDAEFTGLGSDWPRVMSALHEKKMVSWQHCFDAHFLWCFGRLINNTDMHLGNLSLAIDGNMFRILPIYDMCSMGFSPRSGEVLPYSFTPPEFKGIDIGSTFPDVRQMAHSFWGKVAADERISDEFREFIGRGNLI
ncbi:hypothetical protein MNBD_GAMMA26-817 [hydrothermal vent metagenome]|uniref:HipA-like C-terminal domain-containing protein n=1 Tax=hydrothermal vent metagenome TaxID=652676 RepID=A0A3B1B737_9ZZZZ